MQHEEITKDIEGKKASDTKHKTSMRAVTNAKNRLVFAAWHEKAHDLMAAKGVIGNFQACEDLLLSMLKEVPNHTFKIAVDKHGCGTADQFDNCMLALAKLFFNEDFIDTQTE